jgi:hypothetical protein
MVRIIEDALAVLALMFEELDESRASRPIEYVSD